MMPTTTTAIHFAFTFLKDFPHQNLQTLPDLAQFLPAFSGGAIALPNLPLHRPDSDDDVAFIQQCVQSRIQSAWAQVKAEFLHLQHNLNAVHFAPRRPPERVKLYEASHEIAVNHNDFRYRQKITTMKDYSVK